MKYINNILNRRDKLIKLANDTNNELNTYIYINNNKYDSTVTGPLNDIVFDVKSCYMNPFVTNACSKILENYKPLYVCSLYKIMFKNGAFCLGVTNSDEFSSGSTGVTTSKNYKPVIYYKKINNKQYFPGGSSSGAANSASYLTDVSFGTDTGGSIRYPSIICQLYSYKPSLGAIDRHGIIEYSKWLDTISCIFKDPIKFKRVFECIVNKSNQDPYSRFVLKTTKEINNKKIKLTIMGKEYYTSNEESAANILKSLLNNWNNESGKVWFDLENTISLYKFLSSIDIFSECYKYNKLLHDNSKVHKIMTVKDIEKYRNDKFGKAINDKLCKGMYFLYHINSKFNHVHPYLTKLRNKVYKLLENNIWVFPSVSNFKSCEKSDIYQNSLSELTSYQVEGILVIANLFGLPSVTIPVKEGDKRNSLILIGYYKSDALLVEILSLYYKNAK